MYKLEKQIKNKSSKKVSAFTLVELIIVITILAILATISFMSFSSYMGDARDANRLASLKTIESGLELYIAKNAKYPDPELLEVSDKYIKILTGSSLILKQGYIGVENSKKIHLNKPSKDPLDDIGCFYSTTPNNKRYQIGAFLEKDNNLSFISKTYAINYDNRYYYQSGTNTCIVFDENLSVIDEKDLIGDNYEIDFSQDLGEKKFTLKCVGSETFEGKYDEIIDKIIENQNSKPVENIPNLPNPENPPNNGENNCILSNDEGETIILSDDDATACFLS